MIHLVIGGARSGKSTFAESLATNSNDVVYIATATAGDEEMKKRIQHHQQSRPKDWQLIEETLYLSQVIQRESSQTLLIDCMTLWLTNWLCSDQNENWAQEKHHFIEQLQNYSSDIIIVSNEVGSGIVPLGELSREFVDQAGWLNQALAKVADQVTLVVAGLPIALKTQQDH